MNKKFEKIMEKWFKKKLEHDKKIKKETTKEILELIAKKMKKTKELYKDCIESDSLGEFFENVGAYWENDEGYLTLKELKNEIKKKYGVDEK